MFPHLYGDLMARSTARKSATICLRSFLSLNALNRKASALALIRRCFLQGESLICDVDLFSNLGLPVAGLNMTYRPVILSVVPNANLERLSCGGGVVVNASLSAQLANTNVTRPTLGRHGLGLLNRLLER